jgi:hypothetical protein
MLIIINLCEKKISGAESIWTGRTDGQWSLINNHFRCQWWSIKMSQTRWQFVTVKSLIWPWGQGQRSSTMVRDTSSGSGLPTCQIWKAYLERQKSYSPDTICYECRDRFELEVKIQGQRSPTMVRDTSSGGGLPTCQIWKVCLERQKSYSLDTICYGCTDRQTDHYRASATCGGALIIF